MLSKVTFAIIVLLASLSPTLAMAQVYDRSQTELLRSMKRQPNVLARYVYLVHKMPYLSTADRVFAGQFLASSLNELGVYNQAVMAFPLKSSDPKDLVLPDNVEWEGVDALDALTKLAAGRRIVMINEAHHNGHTRVLTLALLPRLRALGFNYFAAEAIGDNDPEMMLRGYPIKASGTEYLRDPMYGEIVREAIRLGFTIIPYDTDQDTRVRDARQAENLFQKVFARDPNARLFVHAGYAHIDKASGRLGDTEPMAMKLAKLTGMNPLSIDQTQFLETGGETSDPYHVLISRFPTKLPEVLINRATGKAWSALPQLYDVNVLLPIALNVRTFGDKDAFSSDSNAAPFSQQSLVQYNDLQRPNWLTLNGRRRSFPISTALCKRQVPCVVDARYGNESVGAIAADRYTFVDPFSKSRLYLYPGQYRLRAWNIKGKTLSERVITVVRP